MSHRAVVSLCRRPCAEARMGFVGEDCTNEGNHCAVEPGNGSVEFSDEFSERSADRRAEWRQVTIGDRLSIKDAELPTSIEAVPESSETVDCTLSRAFTRVASELPPTGLEHRAVGKANGGSNE
jgi:hypothetical protein